MKPLRRDCTEANALGDKTSGIYMIQPDGNGDSMRVFCDMDTDGGGWTVGNASVFFVTNDVLAIIFRNTRNS